MIENKILDFIKMQNIDGIGTNVFLEVPENVPEQYVLIQKTGGNILNHIKHATIAIQSISSVSKYKSAEINEAIIDRLLYRLADNGISQCQLNNTYDFPMTNNKKYRYQAVFNLTYY